MRNPMMSILVCLALAVSGCSGAQQGLVSSIANRVTLASSHEAYLLQAEVAMMFLSYVAVEANDRTPAQAFAAVSALKEAAMAIDCIRGAAADSGWTKDVDTNCGDPGDERFFHTKFLTVARSLFALARASLPDASLSRFLSTLPQASANPLALVGPLLAIAMDAAVIVPRGVAAYYDYRDIIVDAYCRTAPHQTDKNCWNNALDALKRDETQGRTIKIESDAFRSARGLSKANCTRLETKTKNLGASSVDCKLGI